MTITNDADGRTLRRQKDNLKLLPFDTQTQNALAECRDNHSNTRYYWGRNNLESYENFARQIEEKHIGSERRFLFQDSFCASREPDQTSRHQEIDEMIENLYLDSASVASIKTGRHKKSKRPNPCYYN